MKKYKIILVNILIVLIVITVADFYAYSTNMCYEGMRKNESNMFKSYIRWFRSSHKYKIFFNKKVIDDIFLSNNYAKENDASKWNLFRPIENKEQNQSILLFGCSFAYGFRLENNQTFSYKLAKFVPNYAIFNRALTGSTTSQMLYQLQNYDFKEAKNVKAVVYVFIPDHIMRNANSHIIMFFPYYRIKGNGVELEKFSYKYVSTPLLTLTKQWYVNYLYSKEFNRCIETNNLTHKRVLLLKNMLEQSRIEITKKFGSETKFIVFCYDHGKYAPYYWVFDGMKEKNIDIVSLKDLSDEEFLQEKYQTFDKCHPNEEAWDVITPLFYQYLKQTNVIE